MNVFEIIFPRDPQMPWEYVYVAEEKGKVYVVKLGDGQLLKGFKKTYTQKMPKELTSQLVRGRLNLLVFDK